jgi:hypothetical protein
MHVNQDKINHLSKFIRSNEIKVVRESPNKEKPSSGKYKKMDTQFLTQTKQ